MAVCGCLSVLVIVCVCVWVCLCVGGVWVSRVLGIRRMYVCVRMCVYCVE